MDEQIKQQWAKNADAYANLINDVGTPHHRNILVPCIRLLVGDISGKRVLDAGCGEGYLSRLFAQNGAIVTSVDISERLIERGINISKEENLQIEYHVGDICNLETLQDSMFDIVLSNLVLLNVSCLEDALREFYRVLKPEGIAVFSIVHPAFNVYGPGKWKLGEKDTRTHRREGIYFIVDNYFDEKPYERYWKTRSGDLFPEPITFFHRTLSTYFNTARDVGFIVDMIKEPLPKTDDSFFDREYRIPFFLVFRLKKPNNGR